MAFPRIGGTGIGLGSGQPLAYSNTGAPIAAGLNVVNLLAGETFLLPAGTFMVQPGPYTFLQWLDPVSNVWRTVQTGATVVHTVDSDGANYRLANQTGCVIGAAVTTGGAGWTNAIGGTSNFSSITCSGSPTFVAIVGGALGSSGTSGAPTVTTSGSGYNFPPLIMIDPPPTGGVQATAVATLNATGIATIAYTNQGAGYTTIPNLNIIPDQRELNTSTGLFSGTAATATIPYIGYSGTVTAILVTNHGQSFNASGGAPSITFTSGGAGGTTLPTATAIMCWSFMTGANSISGGTFIISQPSITTAANVSSGASIISINNAFPGAGTSPVTQTGMQFGYPIFESQLVQLPRPIRLSILVSGTALTTASNGFVVEDAGIVCRVPQLALIGPTSGGSFFASLSGTSGLGGVPDTSVVQRI